MRDAMSLQRRRRMMLIQSESNTTAEGVQLHGTDANQSLGTEASIGLEVDSAAFEASCEQLFHESQGRRGVYLNVELPGSTQPARLRLDRPFLLIGSDSRCDLRLEHPDVSPRHAYLQWVAGHLFCTDLGSETGLLAGPRKDKSVPWMERQPMQIGLCRMWLEGDEDFPPPEFHPLDRSPQLAAEFPQVRLKFDGVEQTENQWPVDRPLTLIGRGTQCKLRLDHPEMPIVLASLLRTPAGCWLIDLAGQGTTRVNDQAIDFAPLDVGDRLQLGPFNVTVTAAAFGVVESTAAKSGRNQADKAIVALVSRHRELIAELNDDLKEVQSFLDAELLDDAPQLKAALERFVKLSHRHHREMLDSLETFTATGSPKLKTVTSKSSGQHSLQSRGRE